MIDILKQIILPPASLLIAVVIGQICWGRTTAGRRFVAACLVLLYGLSTPLVSDSVMAILEVFPPLPVDGPLPKEAQAIVILGAETRATPEYSSLSPGALTLERLRYGAQLQRRTGLRVLVTGGVIPGATRSLGGTMRQTFIDEFNSPVAWVEEMAMDTHENAVRSTAMLKAEGITRIFLVTHAWHMARAKLAFERAGMAVYPAPTAFVTSGPNHASGVLGNIRDVLPSAKALQNSYFAFHEIFGLAVYWVSVQKQSKENNISL
jgi:uncharacterized SAM-binding protein YcdF (DUF218 family)